MAERQAEAQRAQHRRVVSSPDHSTASATHVLMVGHCSCLLSLPDDVLVALLGKMPPKGLKALGETCQLLRYAVDDETIWKNCFVNRFFSYGSDVNKSDLTVLAQPSLTEGRGWKKECLAREAMLE